ncbi:MAG: DUF177 domain-containing protein [Negativicutes bacterium]
MKIDIGSIVGKNGDSIDFSMQTSQKCLDFFDGKFSIISEILVQGQIKNEFESYFVTGTIKFCAASVCDRCLEKFEHCYKIEFEEKFAYNADTDNDDVFVIKDNEVDLSIAVVENIHVNIPGKLLCKDECKGLCSDCGNNFNEKQCRCGEEKINPQFAKLAKLINN